MPTIARAGYEAPIREFLAASNTEVLGCLSLRSEMDLGQTQRNAWITELSILRPSLAGLDGMILLEYSVPRMGRRADAVLLLSNVVIVIEFKVGETTYRPDAVDQVTDYALDLKNFQKQSHDKFIVPVLLATEARPQKVVLEMHPDGLYGPVCANRHVLPQVLREIIAQAIGPQVDFAAWMASIYSPTPTIVEAAQVLYQGHSVAEISRSESGAENLTKTAEAIAGIIAESQQTGSKSICFVTGVPGAGKTLAGLNIANSWHDPDKDEHAIFLSGNGPLVNVLREALARDDAERAKAAGKTLTKSTAVSKVRAFIQNIHHFRDDVLATSAAPIERVVIFDEAQRAWDLRRTAAFMKSRKGVTEFDMSEPQFLISIMDRHTGWATIICLVGGGQEINKGEAGLPEWFRVLSTAYPDWAIYISHDIADAEDSYGLTQDQLSRLARLQRRSDLHLATSIRSFRAETVSAFVKALLDCEEDKARRLLDQVLPTFPIVLTRDINSAKLWLQQQARGTERYGIIASSEAQRLRPFGLDVRVEIDPAKWFLNHNLDVRSSFYMEDVATEFHIQGLELDWTCVAWDADLRFNAGAWDYHRFHGTDWQAIRNEDEQKYRKNAYRVLLTRARQGIVIYVPEGSVADHTRRNEYYDCTYDYLSKIGIPRLNT